MQHTPGSYKHERGAAARAARREGCCEGEAPPNLAEPNLTRTKKGGVQKRREKRTTEGGEDRNLDKVFDFNHIDR